MLKSLQRGQKSSKGKVEAKENVTTEIRVNIKKSRISIKKKRCLLGISETGQTPHITGSRVVKHKLT